MATLQDVYAKNLQQSYGFPLRIPEPGSSLPESYHEDGLQIGDVGFVSSEGEFHVLFNIRYSPSHTLRLHRRGVPDEFHPINLDLEEIGITRNAIPPERVISSPRVNRVLQSHDPSVVYEFFPSTLSGAILILPFGAIRHDLKEKEEFRRAALEQGQAWCAFARRDSLYLITGFYKAPAWTLGSFSDAPGKHTRQIQVVKRGDSVGMYRWNHTFPVDWRDGPEDQSYTRINQSVFINGFKITVKWWAREPLLEWVPNSQGSSFIKRFRLVFSNLRKNLRVTRIRVQHEPRCSEPFHPSDVINRFLLDKNLDAQVAVTHDDEWTRMIEEKKLSFDVLSKEEDFVRFLSDYYSDSLIFGNEDGAIYLRNKLHPFIDEPRPRRSPRQLNFFKSPRTSKGFSFLSRLRGNLRISITRIRIEDIYTGLDRIPAGFYILVQFTGTKRRTRIKPILLGECVLEWDDEIPLPSDPSVDIQIIIRAAFEFSPMLGNGETLYTLRIKVGDLLKHAQSFDFPLKYGHVETKRSSLFVTVGRRRSNQLGVGSNQEDTNLTWEDSSDLAEATDLGHQALLRYKKDYEKDDLEDSVEHFRHALVICPDIHPCHAVALFNLGMAKSITCQADGINLDTPISLYRASLELRPVGHPDRPTTLLHLVQALLYRYGKQGYEASVASEIEQLVTEVKAVCDARSHERRSADFLLQTYKTYKAIKSWSLADIDRLIPELNLAAQTLPEGYFERPTRLNNLGIAFLRRFELQGDKGDIHDVNRAISNLEDALRSTKDGHPDKPSYLYNLGKSLLARFNAFHELGDLDQATSSLEDAIRLTPSRHPDRHIYFNSLANCFLARFNHHDYFDDLDQAISRFTAAKQLVPHGHPDELLIYLNNLGDCFLIRFDYFDELDDLNQAILHLNEALQITPEDHFDRPRRFHELGNRFFDRYKKLRDVADLDEAISRLESAVQLTPDGSPDHARRRQDLMRAKQVFQEEHGKSSADEATLEEESLRIHPLFRSIPHSRTTLSDNDDIHDDDDDWSDDLSGAFDSITERNTEQNIKIPVQSGHEPTVDRDEQDDDDDAAAMDADPLDEGVNVVTPAKRFFSSTLGSSLSSKLRKESKRSHPEAPSFATSRPLFQRDRCTITITQGVPDTSGRRKKTYVVASDLSEESRYAVEWGIGTMLRDGDEMLIVTVVQNENKVDPPPPNAADRAAKLRNQQERQGLAYVLVRQATSVLQRTRLHVTVSCQAWHAQNARHLLLDIVDYNEPKPTMLIVGSRGTGQVKGARVGSTAEYLIQHCSVPVMVTPRRPDRPRNRSAHLSKRRTHLPLAEAGIDRVAAKFDEDVTTKLRDMERDSAWGSLRDLLELKEDRGVGASVGKGVSVGKDKGKERYPGTKVKE